MLSTEKTQLKPQNEVENTKHSKKRGRPKIYTEAQVTENKQKLQRKAYLRRKKEKEELEVLMSEEQKKLSRLLSKRAFISHDDIEAIEQLLKRLR